ncbi:MAG: septum formation initiator family protein [Candidatus Buchananbacteria bacterium]
MHNHSKGRDFKLPKLFLAICVILSILFILGLSRELVGRHEINKQVKALSSQINDLQDQNKQLTDLVGSFAGSDFIEKEARQKLGLQKPGEKVVLIKRDVQQSESGSLVLSAGVERAGKYISNEEPKGSNPIKWWHYFFK